MENPYVSVIVPVYNSIQYLEETITSILDQTMPCFEVLLVDDGSTDGSGALCDDIGRRDNRVRVFHLKNGGACAARNYALKKAKGEYIAFSDNDDYYKKDLLEDNYAIAQKTGADIVRFSREYHVFRDGKLLKKSATIFEGGFYGSKEFARNAEKVFLAGWGIWAGLYKREFLEKTGVYFDETMRHGYEDMDFLLRLYREKPSVALNPKAYYIWSMRYGHSVSSQTDINGIDAIIKILTEEKEIFNQLGVVSRHPYYYADQKAYFIYMAFRYVSPLKVNIPFRERMKYIRYFSNAEIVKEKEPAASVRALRKYNFKNWLIYILFYSKQYLILYWLMAARHHMTE